MKKKIVYFLLAMMLVGTLGGCGDGDFKENNSGKNTESESQGTESVGKEMSGKNTESESKGSESIEEEMYLVKKTYYPNYSNVDSFTVYEYDEYGTEIKQIDYQDGTISREWENDEYGNIIKSIDYQNGTISREWEYKNEYDDNGNIIKKVRYDADGVNFRYDYEYGYDQDGNVITCFTYESIREKERGDMRQGYKYDKHGNVIERTLYQFDGSSFVSERSEYDEYGNQTKMIIYNNDGSIRHKLEQEYEYDEQGRKIGVIGSSDAQGEEHDKLWEYEFEYEYDEYGNLTKEMTVEDGTVTSWTEYTYSE